MTDFEGDNDEATAIAIQSDGKILVAGYAKTTSNSNDFALVRYNQDGSLDTSFGTNGKVTSDAVGSDYANAIAIQGDGKIVLAGYTTSGGVKFFIVRYNDDGTLDTSFGTNGMLHTDITSGENDIAYGVAIQGDKIVAVGYTGTSADIAIVRYNEDGTPDTSFDTDGIVTTDIDSANNYGRAVVIDSNNILVGGDFGNNNKLFVLRYSSNGTLDTSFNSNGYVTTHIGSGYTYGNSLFLDLDGKILIAGDAKVGTPAYYDFAIVRYMANGDLDTTFGTGGIVTTNFNETNSNDYAYAVKVDSSGRIIVAGHTELSGFYDFAVARYDSNGNLDSSFGKKIYDLGSGDDHVSCMAIQSDGKIIVAGRTKNTATDKTDFALIRLWH